MKDMDLRGVSGWLGFFVIALCVLGPAMELNSNFMDYQRIETANPQLLSYSSWLAFKQYSWVVFGVTVLLRWSAGYAMTARFEWSSVTYTMIVMFSVPLVSYVGQYFVTLATLGSAVAGKTIGGLTLQCAKGLFIMGVWSLYLLKSQRVRNTYTSGMLTLPP